MFKTDAIRLFGNQSAVARAVGLTRSRISQWPHSLTQRQSDLVIGAAVRLGVIRCDLPDGPATHPAPPQSMAA